MRPAEARSLIGSRMRELRKVAGVSLSRAATLSGWDKSHLSRVECGSTKASQHLVSWYDHTFGAAGALLRQFRELYEAVRMDRERTLCDAHAVAGLAPAIITIGNGDGSLPADYDPRDLCLLIDETVPDGTLVKPGQTVTKSWTVHNAGPTRWTGRWLTRQGTGGVPGWLRSPHKMPIPDTVPGAKAVITVTLTAPEIAGACAAYFKATDRDGRLYFPTSASPLYCSIQVID